MKCVAPLNVLFQKIHIKIGKKIHVSEDSFDNNNKKATILFIPNHLGSRVEHNSYIILTCLV